MVLTACQIRAYNNYKEKNREKINEISRRSYYKNKEKNKTIYQANRDPFSKQWLILCKMKI